MSLVEPVADVTVYADRGRLRDPAGDHDGWSYTVFRRSEHGSPLVLGDGSVLVVAWPDSIRPATSIPVRLLFVPQSWLEPSQRPA